MENIQDMLDDLRGKIQSSERFKDLELLERELYEMAEFAGFLFVEENQDEDESEFIFI